MGFFFLFFLFLILKNQLCFFQGCVFWDSPSLSVPLPCSLPMLVNRSCLAPPCQSPSPPTQASAQPAIKSEFIWSHFVHNHSLSSSLLQISHQDFVASPRWSLWLMKADKVSNTDWFLKNVLQFELEAQHFDRGRILPSFHSMQIWLSEKCFVPALSNLGLTAQFLPIPAQFSVLGKSFYRLLSCNKMILSDMEFLTGGGGESYIQPILGKGSDTYIYCLCENTCTQIISH